MLNYDIIIIGAGPSGIFCAYELLEHKKDLKDVSHVPLRPDLQEQEHFLMENSPYPRMSVEIFRRF